MENFIVPTLPIADCDIKSLYARDGDLASYIVGGFERLEDETLESETLEDEDPNDRPSSAIIGGVEHIVGGWAKFAIDTRCFRSKNDCTVRPGDLYSGRTYVYADDAVNSLTEETWRTPGVLKSAIIHLADGLARLEDQLCEPDGDSVWECGNPSGLASKIQHFSIAIPPLTSMDLRAAAADPRLGADPDAMRDLADAVLEVAAAVGEELPPLPQIKGLADFPDHPVRVADDEAVLRLEASVAPRLETLEAYQAALAGRIDEVARAVERSVKQTAQLKPVQ